jgi:hypothetical protein
LLFLGLLARGCLFGADDGDGCCGLAHVGERVVSGRRRVAAQSPLRI